jgi:hypothetical protein
VIAGPVMAGTARIQASIINEAAWSASHAHPERDC